MTIHIRRAPARWGTTRWGTTRTTAVAVSVALCALLLGLSQATDHQPGDYLQAQVSLRSVHSSSMPGALLSDPHTHAQLAGQQCRHPSGAFVGGIIGVPAPPVDPDPRCAAFAAACRAATAPNPRTVGAAGCRGPPA